MNTITTGVSNDIGIEIEKNSLGHYLAYIPTKKDSTFAHYFNTDREVMAFLTALKLFANNRIMSDGGKVKLMPRYHIAVTASDAL